MASSPLPRWAPTPSPSRPLWRPFGSGGGAGSCLPFPLSAVETQPAAAAPGPDGGGGEDAGAGVFLTWEDVWVTAVNGRGQAATILNGVSGCARPGEVLAIMGPSGCGKTTLLDTLAGRLDSSLKKKGEVVINGRRQELTFGTSAYVTQENVVMATLTVREAMYYSAQVQLPDSMAAREKLARADETAREMGLAGAMDTRIGGRGSKGISGGQRRRLSICLEILPGPRLLFLDEPTSGLDSAASFHVMSRIAALARRDTMTVLAVVHQPCSDVFHLFHGLCLLAAGDTIFFGPASHAAQFFASNGYPCPPMRNPSDHFLRTINKDFDMECEEGLFSRSAAADEAIQNLVSSYKSSSISEVANKEMRAINEKGGTLVRRKQASFLTKTLVLTRRSFVNMYRDLGYYWLRLAIYIVICLCLGTIFHNLGYGYDSIQARSSMLMFTGTLLTFMAIGGFPSFVEDMKIFKRERLNGHYGVSTFLISNTVSAAPYLVVIAAVPGAIAYYLAGLQKGMEHFVYFTLVLCSCTMLVEGLMMIVASIVPDFLMGIITGAGVQGVMILTSGFFQLPGNLPRIVWKYPVYYISFHKYALQGLYKNEFVGLQLQSSHQGRGTIGGEQVIAQLFQVETGHSKWVDLAVLCGMAVAYRLLFLLTIKLLDKVKPLLRMARFRPPAHCIHCVERLSC